NSLSDLTAPYITFFFIIIPRPPISTLFPYTTLFRSLFTNAPVHSLGSARAALATEAIVTCGAAFKTSLTVVSFLARRGTGSAECTCHCVIRIISQSYAARGHSPTNTRRDLLQDRRLPYRSDGDSGKSRHYTRSRRPRPARPWRRACHAGDARSH